jgi:hypothetical protein
MTEEQQHKVQQQEEISDAIEHRDVLLDIRALLKTQAGRGLFKYLIKHYSPIELPPMGIEGAILHEGLGQQRAYLELFKLISEADPINAAQLLADNIKDNYAKLAKEYLDGQSD